MRHMRNDHDVVPVPTTGVPMTIPPLEEDDDPIMFEYQKYIMPSILIILVAILLIILIMGGSKACKATCKGSKKTTPVTLEIVHESGT